jgi:hypothetical protein
MSSKRSYKEQKPERLGVMQLEKSRHEEPSYLRLLIQHGFLQRNFIDLQRAWEMWTGLCSDTDVIELSVKLEKTTKNFLPSIASPYSNLAHVLAAMSEKQIQALKQRVRVTGKT